MLGISEPNFDLIEAGNTDIMAVLIPDGDAGGPLSRAVGQNRPALAKLQDPPHQQPPIENGESCTNDESLWPSSRRGSFVVSDCSNSLC